MSGHKYKICQLVNYLSREHAPAFIRSLSYCHQKAKCFSIASSEKTSTPPVRHCPQKSAPHYRVGHLGTGSNLLDRAERSSPEAA